MRKFVFYFIILFIIPAIQFSLSRYFAISGLAPNLILITIVFMGIMKGPITGELLGFSMGLFWDSLSVGLFGSHALIFTIIGYVCGKLNKKWDEEKISTQGFLVFMASVFYWGCLYVLYYAFGTGFYGFEINKIVIIQPFYNVLVTPWVVFAGRILLIFFGMNSRK